MVNKRFPYSWHLLAAIGGAVITLLFALPHVEPLWVLVGALLVASLFIGLAKCPAAMLVPVIFIPEWKDLAFLQDFQRTADLTVVALIVLCVALTVQLIRILGRGESISNLFAGQGAGVGAFFLFAGIVAASYLYTPAKNWGLTQAVRFWGIGGLLFLSPMVLMKREKDFRQFAITFLCFSLVVAAQQILFPRYGRGGKIENIVQTDIGAGWLIGMAILLLLYYQLFESRHVLWVARVFCLPLLGAGLVAATARGPIISLALVLFAVQLVSPAHRLSASRISRWLLTLILILAGSWLSFSALEWTQTRFQIKTRELVAIWHGATPVGSAGKRLLFYRAALREIPERPVLGLGTGGWAIYYVGRDKREYPHNLFLLVAVEEGMVGLLALFAFLTVVGLTVKQIHKSTGGRFVMLFSEVTFCLSCSMFSGDLDSNRFLWFWCGMTLAFSRMITLATENSVELISPVVDSSVRGPNRGNAGMSEFSVRAC